MSETVTLDSKALEAVAKVLEIHLPYEVEPYALRLAESAVAAYLDEASTPTKWCEEHGSGVNWYTGTDIINKVARCDAHRLLTWPGQTSNTKDCVIVDAVLVIGATDD